MRQRRGLGGGKTVSLDRVTLTSRRLGPTGRPGWLLEADGTIICLRLPHARREVEHDWAEQHSRKIHQHAHEGFAAGMV
jgi:hypothetical protein